MPFLIARVMLSPGMFAARASSIARRRRGLPLGSPPPMRAATVISLISLVKILPRLASAAPFLCLIVDHLEWPLMAQTSLETDAFGTTAQRAVPSKFSGG